jgi:hypothetical protein
MNSKQKTVLWIAGIPIVGKLAGGLQVAVRFGSWDIFHRRTAEALPVYLFLVVVAAILVYVFKDKKSKLAANCPRCGCSLKGATPEMIGDKGVCPKCKTEFVIEQRA